MTEGNRFAGVANRRALQNEEGQNPRQALGPTSM